jgi:hypothetical protein
VSEAVFATLREVDPRSAWIHEAHVFTPWLAANLDRLSQAVGIPLELERAEAPVGRYAADILARNPQDGSSVLIENQLEASDHTHLGQIMTYLTGLDAKTMIWVAPSFREEHLSALRWLNEHTVDPFAFFAVRVRVVQIADSPLAPLFEVLERPNGWDRQLQELARESRELSEIGVFRRAFWTHLLEKRPESAAFGQAGADSSRWRAVPGLPLVVVEYLAQDRVGVFVRGPRGAPREQAEALLRAHEAELQERLGAGIGDERTGLFGQFLRIDSRNRENWDRMVHWLEDEAGRYVTALAEILGSGAI